MDTRKAFGAALTAAKESKELSFADFGTRRTYVQCLTKGKYTPTVDKLFEIAEVLDVNPVSLMIETYLILNANTSFEDLISDIRSEREVFKVSTFHPDEMRKKSTDKV
ncbi:helix-turn-helix domain-containing protein [Methylophilus luteus]|uniref:Helix-turn-helix domain-containing protein n=1 Tax=Methylophilus luteus TaxID=640108 RepID=A0ABW3F5Z2_9PROT